MADKNTTELDALIDLWAPLLDLELTHKPNLKEFIANCVLKKDVSVGDVSSAPTKSIDFTGIDYIFLTQTGDVSYSFSGINHGNIKYLKITKGHTNTVTFTGAIDNSIRKSYINTGVEDIIYRITNKDGDIFLESINIDNEVSPLLTKIIEIGDWDIDNAGAVPKLVAHGLTFSKIRGLQCTIRTDADDKYSDLASGFSASGSAECIFADDMNVSIRADLNGPFDNINYNSTSYNRGWIKIDYLP